VATQLRVSRHADSIAVESQHLSVPRPGRTVYAVTEPLAQAIRHAVALVLRGMDAEGPARWPSLFGSLWDPTAPSNSSSRAEQTARSLVAMWVVYRSLHPEADPPTFCHAEQWFTGDLTAGRPLWETIERRAREAALSLLRQLPPRTLGELFPYILDPHGRGFRRDVLRDSGNQATRDSKHRLGSFYTPSDVADFMVRRVLRHKSEGVFLDPSCGTGVYVVAAAKHMLQGGKEPTDILRCLYGVDVDPIAIDGACFALVALLSRAASNLAPLRLWHLARLNLTVRDALTLVMDRDALAIAESYSQAAAERHQLRVELSDCSLAPRPRHGAALPDWAHPIQASFPEVNAGFAGIFGNPPYAPLGSRRDLARLRTSFSSLARAPLSFSTNTFIPFVELMWTLTEPLSRSTMVVPLSIAYGSTGAVRGLRRAMYMSGGNWTFWFFDRTPDALFGDDVKTRTTIVERATEPSDHSSSFSMRTSGLLRWTSRDRSELFQALPVPIEVPITLSDIDRLIPKLGADWERDLYGVLRERHDALDLAVSRSCSVASLPPEALAVGVTAYNWLALYRAVTEPHTSTEFNVLLCPTSEAADWAYAAFASRLTYWLWRVEGDGFHVPLSFVRHLPYICTPWDERDTELAFLGRRLWTEAQLAPVTSVNSGKTTVSFCTAAAPSLDRIDRLLLQRLGLVAYDCLAKRLRDFSDSSAAVGRWGTDS